MAKQVRRSKKAKPGSPDTPTTARMQRPDHAVAEDVELHLAFYADRAARSVEVAAEEQEVRLTGKVAEDGHRTHAEQVAKPCPVCREFTIG